MTGRLDGLDLALGNPALMRDLGADPDAARERAQVAQDELTHRLSEYINRNMYTLSIVAAIFLPLGLITGYLGINVGGIPGEKWDWAFTVVGAMLITFALIEVWLFRRLRWL